MYAHAQLVGGQCGWSLSGEPPSVMRQAPGNTKLHVSHQREMGFAEKQKCTSFKIYATLFKIQKR